MENDYLCPQCGEGYDLPGTCEMCQEELISSDDYKDETSETEGLGEDEKDKSLETLSEEELSSKEDSYNDEDNY